MNLQAIYSTINKTLHIGEKAIKAEFKNNAIDRITDHYIKYEWDSLDDLQEELCYDILTEYYFFRPYDVDKIEYRDPLFKSLNISYDDVITREDIKLIMKVGA